MILLKQFLTMNSTNSDITWKTSYHPKMMLKVILYAYTQSVFSGRKIEKMLNDSIRMMWLSQNQKTFL